MDLRELKRLITLMNENGLARLEVEEEGRRYLLEKNAAPIITGAPMVSMPSSLLAHPAGFPSPPPAMTPPRQATESTVTINSPMVGTFFRSPSPDTEPYVKEGDRVEVDSILCVIEAMKVFNEIIAETTGTIVEILAENQEAVEYNQPLFIIKPA